MATLATHQAGQAAARIAYAAAADALVAAYVELAAYDATVQNANTGGGAQNGFGGDGLHIPLHAVAYPNKPAGSGAFGDRIRARHVQLLAS